jgi:DNA-binding response OmpR family regulator
MQRIKILLVEDDEMLSSVIKSRMEEMNSHYHVMQAFHGKEGIRLWREQQPHIIVADIDMPVMDGWSMVQHIRDTDTYTPILFTSILRTPGDVVKGITIGADNYLKKPFTITELDSYIKALLRRVNSRGMESQHRHYALGIFCFTPHKGALTNTLTGTSEHLSTMPAQVLEMLAECSNDVVDKRTILRKVWGNELAERSLNNIILQLRGLLKADSTLSIETLRNIGYQLTIRP